MSDKDKTIAIRSEMSPVDVILQNAIDKNVNVETLEKILAMREKLNAEVAERAFDEAMAKFQSECPIIKKSKSVNTNSGARAYSYAPLESIVQQTKKLIGEHGFSYRIETIAKDKLVKSICLIKHIGGHSETSEMEVPLGSKTSVMSDSQVTAAAATFSKRYAFCNAFGILTGDVDDETKLKVPEDTGPVSVKAIAKLKVAKTNEELKNLWNKLSAKEKQDDEVLAYKDELKQKLTNENQEVRE